MDAAAKQALVAAAAGAVIDKAETLTALDQAIGDGDHGLNMKRGFEAVLAALPAESAKPWPELLKAIGMALVMKVGGASGPLFGTLFMELGKALPPEPAVGDLAPALARAIAAVQARGRSEPGQKTMLDVLVPVQRALAEGAGAQALTAIAAEAAAATVPMKALRGRAAFLGDRSIGHMDPGACSAALLVGAIAGHLGGRP